MDRTGNTNFNVPGHSPSRNQSAPRRGQNSAFLIPQQPSSTGIQCDDNDIETDSSHSLGPAVQGPAFTLNQNNPESLLTTGIGEQSASGFSDYRMNLPGDGHLQVVGDEIWPPQDTSYVDIPGNSTPDYGMARNGPMVRGESAIPDEGRPSNGHYYLMAGRPDAKSTFEGPMGPKHPKFEDRKKRFGSFVDWEGYHSPKQLCDNGLFYTGESDRCVCFYCGVTIYNWEDDDDIVEEHHKHSLQQNKHCSFAMQKKLEKDLASVNISGQTMSPVEERRQSHRKCQVCKTRQIAVTQFMCGHIVCVECAPVPGQNKVCQICGAKVVRTSAYDHAAL